MNEFNREWLIVRGNTLQGDVDTWAYHPDFDALCVEYRTANRSLASNGAIYRGLIRLRKTRASDLRYGYRAFPEAVGSQPELLELKPWQEEILITVYRQHWMPIDQFAYSGSFDSFLCKMRATGIKLTRHELFRHLRNLCKAGKVKQEEPQGFLGRKK